MKRILLLLLFFALPALGASSGPFVLTATTSPCALIQTADNFATVGIRVTGTFSATLQPGVTIQGQPSTNTSVVPVGSTTSQNTITAAGAYTASVAGASTFQVCATGFVSGTATIWLNVSTGISAKAVVSAGGGVQSVTGTANQIASSGGANPVLSLPAAIAAPGSLTLVTPLAVTSGGTGQLQAGQYGLMLCRSAVNVLQSTQAEAAVFTCTIPAGLLSANSVIDLMAAARNNTVTGSNTVRIRIGAQGSGLTGTILSSATLPTSNITCGFRGSVAARNATNSQLTSILTLVAPNAASTAGVNVTSSIDFTAAVDIVVTLQQTNADASGMSFQSAAVIVYP